MLVKYWMRQPVAVVEIDEPLEHAATRMKEYYQPILPVLRDGKLVGVLRDENVAKAIGREGEPKPRGDSRTGSSQSEIEQVMSKTPPTVPPDFTLEEAATVLLLNKIPEAFIVDRAGRLLGVISQQDVLWALMSLNGFESRGVEFALEVPDHPGAIKQLTDIVRSYNGRLASLLTSFSRAAPGHKRVYIKAYGVDRKKMSQLKQELSIGVTMLYMIDRRENKREEYVVSDAM